MDVQSGDLVTVALLVALEGLLSADNALVMAIMVLGLPKANHRAALRYGLIGGFVFRVIATLLASSLIQVGWIRLVGGLYLLYLTYTHFRGGEGTDDRRQVPAAKAMLGLSPFWATVVRVELINLAFSIDSILVAVAMSPKLWVVVTGGILGIVAMRLVVGSVADARPALSGARGRRVHHHCLGRIQVVLGIPASGRARPLRDPAVVLARPDWRDLRRGRWCTRGSRARPRCRRSAKWPNARSKPKPRPSSTTIPPFTSKGRLQAARAPAKPAHRFYAGRTTGR